MEEQAVARVRRRGKKGKVEVHHFVAEESREEEVWIEAHRGKCDFRVEREDDDWMEE